MFYRFGRMVVKIFMIIFYPYKVIGAENVPASGSVLLCPNHISNLDPPLVAVTSKRSIVFMAKKELFEVPVLKYAMKAAKAIPVNRGSVDRETMRKGLKVLNEEQLLCIFPEGTTYLGELGKGLAGAGFFALRTNAAVVPCAIIGPFRLFRRTQIIYGKPIDMERFRLEKTSPEVVVEAIMEEIKKLIDQHRKNHNFA